MEDDGTLVSRCLSGDTNAFGVLVDRYQRPLYNAALRLVDDADDAADVTQDAFVKAYEHLAQYRPTHKFFSWIYRIVINESLNHVKRSRRMTELSDNDGLDLLGESDVRSRDISDLVDKALQYLSPEERAIVLLKHIEGFTYHEISYIFEIPQKTVKSRLYSARQHLKNVLHDLGLVAYSA